MATLLRLDPWCRFLLATYKVTADGNDKGIVETWEGMHGPMSSTCGVPQMHSSTLSGSLVRIGSAMGANCEHLFFFFARANQLASEARPLVFPPCNVS